MKWWSSIILTIVACVCVGCNDDTAAAGTDALLSDEQVRVCVSTFGDVVSQTDSLDGNYVVQTPDSFLLGAYNTEEWATIKADILAQFACPVGVSFPANTTIDSAILFLSYSSWFGDGNGPLLISVNEMDRGTFKYEGTYSCQTDLASYWSGEDSTKIVEADKTVTPLQNADTFYSPQLQRKVSCARFHMNKRFIDRIQRMHRFPDTQDEFCQNYFKGLYITTRQFASSILYINNMQIAIYYHYNYTDEKGQQATLTGVKNLYANNEVRQVNRYTFPNKKSALDKLQAKADSFNFIVSPAYMYTLLNVPIKQYVDTIQHSMLTDSKTTLRPYINKASMRVDVLNVSESTSRWHWANPASDMLLIVADSINGFFLRNGLPSADYCMVSSLLTDFDSDYKIRYYYNFDLSTVLQYALRNSQCPDSIQMVMVPVHVEYSTTSTATIISKVKFNQTITFTQIKSAQFQSDPLNTDVVYSGVSIIK